MELLLKFCNQGVYSLASLVVGGQRASLLYLAILP